MLSLRQVDALMLQLKQKLESISIDHLALESGLVQRKSRKITPLDLLLGLFIMVLTGGCSLRSLATTIGLLCHRSLSKQAVDKRIKAPAVKFLESVLAAALMQSTQARSQSIYPLLSTVFHRVLVQDSTSVALDRKLAEHFPGIRNQTQQQSATLKIQTVFDLLSERFCYFDITPFTKNDQEASTDVLSLIDSGDVLIRDLGYFVLSTMSQIQRKGAYFLSRLIYGISLYKTEVHAPFNLLKALRKHGHLDINIYVGANEKLHARLVAIPLPKAVAAARRRKAKTNRDRRYNPSKDHLALLGWEIFLTNIDRAALSATHIAELYHLWWRIETIFKAWKSQFHLTNMPQASVLRVKSSIYAMLIFITLFHTQVYLRLYRENAISNGTHLSLLKVARFFKEQLWAVALFLRTTETLKQQIFYHCVYESRKDRLNHPQRMSFLS
jgi:hypothetical protein